MRGVGIVRVGAVLAVLAVVCALPGTALAQPPEPPPDGGQLLLLMDSSGSMAGPDGTGHTKIDAAKSAIGRAVDVAPPTARVGLRVYGAERAPDAPGACQDTRLTVPVGAGNRPALRGAAGALTPRGQTPIGYSLQQAATDFTAPGPREILLVSDGIETCGADPCAVARQLAAQGVDLRIDVVGFQVDPAARDQLRCVAGAGHGTYSDAGDGAALQSLVGRTSSRALREYRPGGTPVVGSPDPASAPVLVPGQYIDTMPDQPTAVPRGTPATEKWYAVDRRDAENLFVSATVVPPFATPSTVRSADAPVYGANGVAVRLRPPEPDRSSVTCGSGAETDLNYQGEDSFVPLTATATLRVDRSVPDCNRPGRFLIAVSSGSADHSAFERQPVELQVLSEPQATNVAALPPPDTAYQQVPLPGRPTTPGTPVAGSARFTDAPTLRGSGSYDDTVLPGETLFYRIRLDWGQRLLARVDAAPPPGYPAARGGVADPANQISATIYAPNRGPVRSNARVEHPTAAFYDPVAAGVTETAGPEVRYRNREASNGGPVTGPVNASLAGYYYVGVHLSANGPKTRVEGPFHLSVAVVGQPSGAPAYAGVGGDADPVRQQDPAPLDQASPGTGAGPGPSGAVLVVTIVAVVALLGGGLAVGLGWRRRRR